MGEIKNLLQAKSLLWYCYQKRQLPFFYVYSIEATRDKLVLQITSKKVVFRLHHVIATKIINYSCDYDGTLHTQIMVVTIWQEQEMTEFVLILNTSSSQEISSWKQSNLTWFQESKVSWKNNNRLNYFFNSNNNNVAHVHLNLDTPFKHSIFCCFINVF